MLRKENVSSGWFNLFSAPVVYFEKWTLVSNTVMNNTLMPNLSDKAYAFLDDNPDKLPLLKKLRAIQRLDNRIWHLLIHNQLPSFLSNLAALFENNMLWPTMVDILISYPNLSVEGLIKGYQALGGLDDGMIMHIHWSEDQFFNYFSKTKKLIALLSIHYEQLEWLQAADLLDLPFFKMLMSRRKALFYSENGSVNVLNIFHRYGLLEKKERYIEFPIETPSETILKRLSLPECQMLIQMDSFGLLTKDKILSWWPTPKINTISPIEFLAEFARQQREGGTYQLRSLATRLFHYKLSDDFYLFSRLCEKATSDELRSEDLTFEKLLAIYDYEMVNKILASNKINYSPVTFQAAPIAPPLPNLNEANEQETGVLYRRRAAGFVL